MTEGRGKSHWSFLVTDARVVYPIAALLLVAGLVASFVWRDATQFARVGNFIIGTGVWISLRYTLREGISRKSDENDNRPVLPGPGPAFQLNMNYFARKINAVGDALLQLHGFALVIVGSAVSSYGDLVLTKLCPGAFK